MALKYKNQVMLEQLSKYCGKPLTTHRLSDLRIASFFGRGSEADEINYIHSSIVNGTNKRLSDNWVAAAVNANKAPITKRWNEDRFNYLDINGFQ